MPAPSTAILESFVGEMAPQGPATSETPGGRRGDYYCAYVQEAFSQISNLFQKVEQFSLEELELESPKIGPAPTFDPH